MAKALISLLHGIVLIVDMQIYVVSKLIFLNILYALYGIGVKFLSNDMKGTGDMANFVLLCKLFHSFMHANILVVE